MYRALFYVWAASALLTATWVAGPLQGGQATQAGQGTAEVYLVPFSHLDYFWGGTREECLARGNQIFAKAIKIARQQPEFRFLIEDNDFLAYYVDTYKGSREVEELRQLVKAGRFEIAPKWAAIYQNLPDGEAQVRNIAIGKRYAREVFGVEPMVAHLGDLPGYTLQFPQILEQTGLPYMVMTRMGPSDHPLFNWRSPDGSHALVWSGGHYGAAIRFGFHSTVDEERRTALLKFVDKLRAASPLPVYMSWGSDLWAPTEKIVENVRSLNAEGRGVRIIIATPNDFFKSVKQFSPVAELSGEIPSSWPNLLSSLTHMWPRIVPATNALLNAEKFAALNHAMGMAEYPREQMDHLWRKLLEAMDHNQDGQGGYLGDERKIAYMRLAEVEGGEILRDMLRNIAGHVRVAVPRSHPIVVFNASGWTRTDVVKAHLTLFGEVAPSAIQDYKQGMRLVDENGAEVPFHVEEYMENISRALSIVFVARDVPSLGYRTFYLVPSETPQKSAAVSKVERDADKDLKEPRRPRGTDVVETEFYRLTVDAATGRVSLFDKALNQDVVKDMEIVGLEERGGNYIGVEPLSGRTIPNANIQTEIEENNGVRTIVKVTGSVSDIPVIQRLIFYKGMKRLDIENTVTWKDPRLVRIEQLFPLQHKDAQVQYGVPFGSNSASNIIPNTEPHASDEITKTAWMQSRDIQNWLWAGGSDWGVTITADHHQVKLGDNLIRAEMVRGTRFTSARVVKGGEVGSLHYPPPGTYVFRYSLSSGSGDWTETKAWRSGIDFNNGLIPVSVMDEVSTKSLPSSHSFCSVNGDNLVISSLKKADAGDQLVLRMYEMIGRPSETSVTLLGQTRAITEVNLLEEAAGKNTPRRMFSARPYQIKTVTMDVAKRVAQ